MKTAKPTQGDWFPLKQGTEIQSEAFVTATAQKLGFESITDLAKLTNKGE